MSIWQPPRHEGPARRVVLTPTELRVLEALVTGGTVEKVARNCGMTYYTARSHMKRMYEKFGVSTRAEVLVLVYSGAVEVPVPGTNTCYCGWRELA